MATVDEIASDLVGSFDAQDALVPALRWINNRYVQLVRRARFRHLRQIGELSIPAQQNTGTVSVTRGSTTVTGVGTGWSFLPDTEGWYFRAGTAWYKIDSSGGATDITLASAYAEDDVSGGSYALIKRFHPLESDARWIGQFAHDRLRSTLDGPIAHAALDVIAPDRNLIASLPEFVAQAGVDSSGYLIVEIYPYCSRSEMIHYEYWSLPEDLGFSSDIPAQVDHDVLKEGALIDPFRWFMAKAAKQGKVDEAALWRNESRAQETRWKDYIKEAVRAARGAEDITAVLGWKSTTGRRIRGDIRSAEDYVLYNWTYPANW